MKNLTKRQTDERGTLKAYSCSCSCGITCYQPKCSCASGTQTGYANTKESMLRVTEMDLNSKSLALGGIGITKN